MSEEIKVSIILPSLNVVKYIKDAVKSVCEQTLKDIEIICVDAGSTDGTKEIIEELSDRDTRIIVINSPVKSYGFQVNKGLEIAKGEYTAILETDDYVHQDMYAKLYEVANAEQLDYVKCNYDTYVFDDDGNKVFTGRKISKNLSLYENVFVPLDYTETAFDDWYLWNGIYRTEFLKSNNIRFSETKGAAFQDIGFLHKTTTKAKSAKYIAQSLYRYCVGRVEASSKSDKTIRFVRQEYGLLLNSIGDTCTIAEWKLLYSRMAKSFTRACMDCSDELLNSLEVANIIRWFQVRLIEAENRGYISNEQLPVGLRENYKHLINPVAGYQAYRKKRIYEIRDFLGEDNQIVIFGCGMYGKEALEYINSLGKNVSSFMDNASLLWGTQINGISVECPEKIKDNDKNTRYVIANENYANEIANQIKNIFPDAYVYIF